MSFLKSLFGVNSLLGVDIGTTSIKIAEITRTKDKLRLENYGILETRGYLERFNEAFQTSTLKLSQANVLEYLRILLKRVKPGTKDALASVPAFLVFSTLIEVPAMSEAEMKNFMEFQAKQYIPMPLEAVSIDWMKVGERTDANQSPKHQILLVSIPNDHLNKFQTLFKSAGLNLKGIELEGISAARALGVDVREPALVLDIGSRSTSFSVVHNGFLKFSGQVDFSGGSLTQALANGLGISQRRAEDLKKQRGIMAVSGGEELSTLMLPLLDVIIYEAKRLITNYETGYEEKVTQVIISGGGANLLGIEDYFTEHFGLPARKINPFSRVSLPKEAEGITGDLGPLIAVATGLGLRDLI